MSVCFWHFHVPILLRTYLAKAPMRVNFYPEDTETEKKCQRLLDANRFFVIAAGGYLC